MTDLKVALEDLAADSASGQVAPVARGPRPWRWGWVALIPIVLIAAYFVTQSLRPEPPAPQLRAVPLAALPGVVRSPSFSPDGNHVTFTWTGPKQDNPDIYVQQIGAGSPLQLTTDPANDYSPVWSPDGRWIGFLRQQPDPGIGRPHLRFAGTIRNERDLLSIMRKLGRQRDKAHVIGGHPGLSAMVPRSQPGRVPHEFRRPPHWRRLRGGPLKAANRET
jgi:WD40-like Beta Propeller Repeat